MALGRSKVQQRFENPREILGDRLKEGSIYRLLADHGDQLFRDDYFADLYEESVRGRPTIPARVMATVMLLQAFEGLRTPKPSTGSASTCAGRRPPGSTPAPSRSIRPSLVGQRNRLRASARPRRLFEDTKVVAKETGALKDRARVLDSTPLYDAVATQDTVTQLRAAIRKLLAALDQAGSPLAEQVRAALFRDDEYATWASRRATGTTRRRAKPWSTPWCTTAWPRSAAMDGETLAGSASAPPNCWPSSPARTSKQGDDGVFRIVQGVAKDRVISTVDPEARHGHKSRNRHFDGYKAHLSIDPDSELIDEVAVTPANTPTATPCDELLEGLADEEDKPEVLGDSAYADGATRQRARRGGLRGGGQVPPVRNATGAFTKDRFIVDLETHTVTCPAGRPRRHQPHP